MLQIIRLYGWYFCTLTSFAESPPFYHCNLATLALLCIPNRSIYKRYFALLDIARSICSTIYLENPNFLKRRATHDIQETLYLTGYHEQTGTPITV